jgi:hypothetical protein
MTLPPLKGVGSSVQRHLLGVPGLTLSHCLPELLGLSGLPGGEHSQTFVPDIACGVEVPLMVRRAIAIPLPIREREAVVDRTTHVAQPGRGEKAVDLDAELVVPGAFVSPPVSELLVDDGGLRRRLGLSLRALLAPRHRTLRLAELASSLAEELGGGDGQGGVAECGVVDQPDVDPDRLRGVGHRDRDVGHLELDDQGDVPLAVGPALERGAVGLLGNVLALEDPGVADLGDEDSAVLDLDPPGDPEPGLVPLAALELRVSRPLRSAGRFPVAS